MKRDPKAYTAVIYFHGIGNPRRHVSLAQFLDYFDRFGERQGKDQIGKPRDFTYGSDLLGDQEPTHYVSFKRVIEVAGKPRVAKNIRIYEAYWAPESGGRANALFLAFWLIKRLLNPLVVLFSRWRAFPGLRLSHLHRLIGQGITQAQAQRIERAYRDFENWENRSTYRKGSFTEFREFCSKRISGDLQAIDRWKYKFRSYNYSLSFYASIVTACSVFIILIIARSFSNFLANFYDFGFRLNHLYSFDATASAIGLILGGYLYAKGDSYVLDVVAWTADTERGERFQAKDRVVKYGQSLLRRVTSDPRCQECVVIGHSLGTSIASEALLREGRLALITDDAEAKARISALAKVKYVFTVGSPVDRIFYLFQTDSSFSHRYSRLIEEQRLAVDLPPFAIPQSKAEARIVNFWSRFDPISSEISSLRKNSSDRRDAIINIEALPPAAPLPIGSHTSFFADAAVMKPIYWATMTGRLPRDFQLRDKVRKLPLFFGRGSVVALLLIFTGAFWSLATWTAPAVTGITAVIGIAVIAYQRRAALKKHSDEFGDFIQR
ncbi:hypothetical protein [Novosphingobium marinum]|uniref:Pimeloyl-ACP methyl ester carboxylesterase n=1 Tax=Novosphingobium marinum TaxID=1514948 RepID=A0A7Y9XZL1_9SPHN|nr:hypothetical protein [Novosphingobium marinum]NYH96028.1 pimeloyl-ACP methyl ester carboxylesterase [Novosphingobium marinum]